jgi:SAM-dependent methyltransferase
MKGFVPTPTAIVDAMVAKLFAGVSSTRPLRILDPGCGEGVFIEGVLRYCNAHKFRQPTIVGVELDPKRAATARSRLASSPNVEIRRADFLTPTTERFDLIIGNPPYVSILGLDIAERTRYRALYTTARGRFDLYGLFFEQALRMLLPSGRLVFITPEKFLYVESARPLRELLLRHHVEELEFVREDAFGDLVTYPLITTIAAAPPLGPTRVRRRDGSSGATPLNSTASWLPALSNHWTPPSSVALGDVCQRISCGVATGADGVFVAPRADVSPSLAEFAHPTISGRQIKRGAVLTPEHVLLSPYDKAGRLLPESSLGALGRYLRQPGRRERLESRSCVDRKSWFAYHDNMPVDAMLRPKLLCKDITEHPFFVADHSGEIVPRHSVYYLVPFDSRDVSPLGDYLNSEAASAWLRAHCQRAAKGFLRMQSHVLKRLPIPQDLAASLGSIREAQLTLEEGIRA